MEERLVWWNGALKRLPSNLCKTSEQSHAKAKKFMQTIVDYNPSMLVYGSDHCCANFNGTTAAAALASMEQDTRKNLWRFIV